MVSAITTIYIWPVLVKGSIGSQLTVGVFWPDKDKVERHGQLNFHGLY